MKTELEIKEEISILDFHIDETKTRLGGCTNDFQFETIKNNLDMMVYKKRALEWVVD